MKFAINWEKLDCSVKHSQNPTKEARQDVYNSLISHVINVEQGLRLRIASSQEIALKKQSNA